MSGEPLKFGDVIQLGPAARWGGCLAFVEEVRSWGVTANIVVPHDDDRCAIIPIRLEFKDFKRVGAAQYLVVFQPEVKTDDRP